LLDYHRLRHLRSHHIRNRDTTIWKNLAQNSSQIPAVRRWTFRIPGVDDADALFQLIRRLSTPRLVCSTYCVYRTLDGRW
jgi:hypothetical protein